jgi:uncharacterized membrane protein
LVFVLVFGTYNFLPFLAPVAMKLGWEGIGRAIYAVYSVLCHQMAQRSLLLFGPHPMLNLDQLPLALTGSTAADMQMLRQFIGNAEIGWKVAWSDRMVYMYSSVWLASVVFWLMPRKRPIKHMPFWLFGLLLLPMLVDGSTHFLSDLAGLTHGFRYENAWLARLTRNAFPATFYSGDALGSFNSWMRMFSGILFGSGVVGLAMPIIDGEMRCTSRVLAWKPGAVSIAAK